MGGHRISSYIVHYRENKKKAVEEERRRRTEDSKRRPEIIDPSYEILCTGSPNAQSNHDLFQDDHGITATPSTTSDDWHFQRRGASTMPQYQFEPYCDVTPKSSVSSNYSAASSAPSQAEYDMSWNTAPVARPRPQSYLPPSASASYSMSTTDLHRGTLYQSKRHSTQRARNEEAESLPSYERSNESQPGYRLEASLSRPFSVDDPLDFLSNPESDNRLYRNTSHTVSQDRLPTLPEYTGVNVPEYRGDLAKQGHRI